MRFVRSLKLNMTTRELYTFYALADRDNDERIVWSEVRTARTVGWSVALGSVDAAENLVPIHLLTHIQRQIEQEVPLILAKIYQGLSPSPADWCTMILPSTKKEEEEQVVYFNKRTSEVRRVRPAEMDAPAAPLSAPASPAAKEVVLENTRTFDSLVTWLDWGKEGRKKEEADGQKPRRAWLIRPSSCVYSPQSSKRRTSTGTAPSPARRWPPSCTASAWGLPALKWSGSAASPTSTATASWCVCWRGGWLRLGLSICVSKWTCCARSLTPALFLFVRTQEWKEVLEMTPLLFQKLYSGIEPGPHDFCVITDAEQRVHFLNKRTGAVTSEPPPGFVALPPDEETEEEAEATVTNKPKAEAEVP